MGPVCFGLVPVRAGSLERRSLAKETQHWVMKEEVVQTHSLPWAAQKRNALWVPAGISADELMDDRCHEAP